MSETLICAIRVGRERVRVIGRVYEVAFNDATVVQSESVPGGHRFFHRKETRLLICFELGTSLKGIKRADECFVYLYPEHSPERGEGIEASVVVVVDEGPGFYNFIRFMTPGRIQDPRLRKPQTV